MPTPNPSNRREYKGAAAASTLASSMSNSDGSFTLTAASNWPTGSVGQFIVTVSRGQSDEEKILCSAQASKVVTVATRGFDGTSAQAHASGSTVECTISAFDADEWNQHTNATGAVHGVAGNVVGDTDTQTLTNKTVNTASGNVLKVNGNTLAAAAGSATVSVPNSTDTLVGRNTTDTLANKTLVDPVVNPAVNTDVALTVTGVASQSGDLQRWTDSTPTTLAKVTSAGIVVGTGSQVVGGATGASNIFAVAPAGMSQATAFLLYRDSNNVEILSVHPQGSLISTVTLNTAIPIVAKGAASQGVSLQEWQNSSGTPLAKIDQSGNLTATNVTSAWTAYTPTFTNITSGGGSFRALTMGKTMFIRGVFSGGTVTATGVASISIPGTTSSSLPSAQIVPGQLSNGTNNAWQAGASSNAINTNSLTAGTSLANSFFTGVLELS